MVHRKEGSTVLRIFGGKKRKMNKLRAGYRRVFCPVCMRRIGEGTPGTDITIKCTGCNNLIKVTITDRGAYTLLSQKKK